jgi:hypothetical protein
MTLRDYFAGQTLMGWCVDMPRFITNADRSGEVEDPTPAQVATRCYAYADAMLKERAKP